jgi:hypothetical protein
MALLGKLDKALDVFLASLDLLQSVSEVAPVPFMAGAITIAIKIAETVKVRHTVRRILYILT